MKRIITLLLAAVMLVSTMVISTGAAGTLVFSDNFDEGFMPRNWVTNRESCHFEWDKYNNCINGYDDSKVLQSNFGTKYNRWWDTCYASIDFQIRAFDDFKPEHEGRTHSVSLWYRDRMDIPEGEQEGAVYTFNIEIETGKATLRKEHTWTYYENGVKKDANTNTVIAEGQIDGTIEVGEDAPFYSVGVRITAGKLEYYFEEKLVISAEVDPDDPKLGDYTMNSVDESVGSKKSAFLVLNGGNWLALDNFEIWTPDYDFVAVAVNYGDVNGDGDINLADVTKMLQAIAKWEITGYDAAAANVNGDDAVNLADVTQVLKVIAKWDGVVLG